MSVRFAAGTIVARNYIPQARVLQETFAVKNAEVGFATLVVDGTEADRSTTGVGSVLLPQDLGLDIAVLHRMMTVYDVMEFATALKPALLATLLRGGAEAAAYFDPDIQVFDDLADVFADAVEHGIVLTPHVLDPLPRDGKLVSEQMIMLAGIFNLGFIAVGVSSHLFLAWWNDRLRDDAISDPQNALFTDQRWIDWVPALFPHRISRDRGLNVAYWNLHERPIGRVGDIWTAGGERLRFLHFSGYDPRTPWLLSKHAAAEPRVLLSRTPLLRRLAEGYGERLLAHGFGDHRDSEYRFSRLSNGVALDYPVRRLVRSVLTGATAARSAPPDAFADPDGFARWLLSPQFGHRLAPLAPIEYALWAARSDLQWAYPEVLTADGRAYLDWFSADPRAAASRAAVEEVLPEAVIDSGALRVTASAEGWLVLVLTVPGTEEDVVARRFCRAFSATGAPVHVVGLDEPANPRRIASRAVHPNVLVLTPAGAAVLSDAIVVLEQAQGRRIVAVIGDGDDSLPDVDEVWSIGADGRRSDAVALPYPIDLDQRPPLVPREALGLPESGSLVIADAGRSGGAAAEDALQTMEVFIAATRSSGPDPVGTVLVLLAGQLSTAERERLIHGGRGREDIVVLDRRFSLAQLRTVAAHATVVLSLHAAPVASLLPATALSAGTAVVASGGPAALVGITADSASLVPLRTDGAGRGIDVAHAVRALRVLLHSPGARTHLRRTSAERMRADYSTAAIARLLRKRLEGSDALGTHDDHDEDEEEA
ncbi:hypothetical protein GSU68_03220 [Rathayibacter sp. VKM Ac-2759]|uniref:hypothetical protein n=1 Tax=Rathayibacter sp. VKM Ac-2759 TaxID=2609252 RepID=UPI0013170E07|nr:hypothetical protein [Rathayibacter sp. VKM Ac-2759]QHC65688.1 hypothetical protein GSU68_03220 [Rathayibacter sp. VKM Ac-2759]